MVDYREELKDTIKLKDRMTSTIRKIDEFSNKLIELFLRFVPEWFKLMEWLVISGAILYVYLKYKSYVFNILFSISFSLLFFFIIFSVGKRLNFINKYTKKHLLFSSFIFIFSFILYALVLYFLLYIISGLSLP